MALPEPKSMEKRSFEYVCGSQPSQWPTYWGELFLALRCLSHSPSGNLAALLTSLPSTSLLTPSLQEGHCDWCPHRGRNIEGKLRAAQMDSGVTDHGKTVMSRAGQEEGGTEKKHLL